MDARALYVIGIALSALGCIGCVVPVLPGPIIAYAALWLIPEQVGPARLWIAGAAVAVATIADYVLPSYFSRKFKCSKLGVAGCFIGTIVGLFNLPHGLVLGPILGAVIGELISGSGGRGALRGGLGAFLGFVSGIALKLAVTALCVFWFFSSAIAAMQ